MDRKESFKRDVGRLMPCYGILLFSSLPHEPKENLDFCLAQLAAPHGRFPPPGKPGCAVPELAPECPPVSGWRHRCIDGGGDGSIPSAGVGRRSQSPCVFPHLLEKLAHNLYAGVAARLKWWCEWNLASHESQYTVVRSVCTTRELAFVDRLSLWPSLEMRLVRKVSNPNPQALKGLHGGGEPTGGPFLSAHIP
ncbi:hypothetical protein VTI28DRAFT_3630 [Corynascus sepedonium]